MAKEWIDVVDTAVKIGLGALISGSFTYLGLKFKSSSENKKHLLENKTKMLEEISVDIHEYFISWRFYASIISGITKQKAAKNQDCSDFTEGQKQKIKEREDDLIDSWSKRESAISKLTLIKANKTADALNKCKELEKELRNQIVFDKVVPTYEYVKEYQAKVRLLVKETNTALSDFYSSLET